MAEIKNFEQFIDSLANQKHKPFVKRFNEILENKKVETKTYLIEIVFESSDIILEHEVIKNFQKSSNRYYYHAEETHPPVKAHYHVIPLRGKKEIYAVNMDGTSHHKKNKGYEIPRKEADELRKLGVDISINNIIEHIEDLVDDEKKMITESITKDCVTIFIEIEE